MGSSLGSLPDEAGDIEDIGQDVGQDGSLGAVGPAEPGGAFHSPPGLVGIAALGVTLASHAQFPGRGAHLEVTGQADVAIGEGDVHGGQVAQGVRILVGAVRG